MALQSEAQSFPLTKTSKTPDNVISLSDFFSASSDMVFICKHLRPYPLNPLHLPSSADAFVRQKREKQSCRVWSMEGRNMFLMFLLFESFPIRKERPCCWQAAGGSSLTARDLAAAGRGTQCQTFKKSSFMFLFNIKKFSDCNATLRSSKNLCLSVF